MGLPNVCLLKLTKTRNVPIQFVFINVPHFYSHSWNPIQNLTVVKLFGFFFVLYKICNFCNSPLATVRREFRVRIIILKDPLSLLQ